ncbi:MAG TPA: helix-turn-helix domain-containing protein [Streptosporangiaceae bacterium]|nr:helix-turn-helix domain-containing protein [Streptosporangiaceae bacterium]
MTDQEAVAGAVARTVRALRAGHGWSLDKLAARSGVSKGVLVALEQGKSNPNLSTLVRISDTFGVPVTRLLEAAAEQRVRVSSRAAVLWRGPSGGSGTLIAATDAPWAAELWRWELAEGESYRGTEHPATTRELVAVEEGTLTLTVAGVRHEVTAGRSAQFPGGCTHTYANEQPQRLRMTMVVVVPPADHRT